MKYYIPAQTRGERRHLVLGRQQNNISSCLPRYWVNEHEWATEWIPFISERDVVYTADEKWSEARADGFVFLFTFLSDGGAAAQVIWQVRFEQKDVQVKVENI